MRLHGSDSQPGNKANSEEQLRALTLKRKQCAGWRNRAHYILTENGRATGPLDFVALFQGVQRPRKSSQYVYSYEWVKKDNYTIVKIESYNKKGLVRVIDYKDYEQVKGIWTARTTEVLDVTRKSRTTLKYDKVDFNMPMKDDEFTLQTLRRES